MYFMELFKKASLRLQNALCEERSLRTRYSPAVTHVAWQHCGTLRAEDELSAHLSVGCGGKHGAGLCVTVSSASRSLPQTTAAAPDASRIVSNRNVLVILSHS
jgi:hypothetical protein